MSAVDEVRDLAGSIASHRSLVLWDVEVTGRPGNQVVRVYVDADGGLDLDTVAEVSEELSRGLDLRDPIPGRYTLEVSTPGLERALRRPEHYRRSLGRTVTVKTHEVVAGGSRRIDGVIAAAGDDDVTLHTERGPVTLRYEQIRSARTVFEWK